MNTSPKYQVGQVVRVEHKESSWVGTIQYCADTGDAEESAWEYEVSNAPCDRAAQWGESMNAPGYRWYPLVWECEIKEVLP